MSSFSVKYKTSLFGNMDRNNMRSSYVNSGPRSLPHMSGKRHNGNGHNGNSHSGNHGGNHGGNHSGNHGGNHGGNHSGNHHGNHSGSHSGNGHNGARLSPPAQGMPGNQHPHNNNNNNNPNGQHDDIINYIYDSWNKVTRELERGSDEAKYYQEVVPSRHLANFKPFNLEEWWGRRIIQSINRNKHRS